MAGLLLLPIAALVTPSWVVEVPGRVMSVLPDAVRERVSAVAPLLPRRTVGSDVGAPTGPFSGVTDEASVARAVFANTTIQQALAFVGWLWLGGTAVLLFSFMTGLAALARLRRRSPPLHEGRVTALARELSLAMGIRGHVPVLRGRAGAMPMSWGLVRRVILLPEGAERWDDFHLRTVLRHELAHVRRRDCLTQAVAEISLALHWLNPLAWLAARRLRVEREHACDDAVVLGGALPPITRSR
jgi:beta-lactamase regulating signal transducer with metallopeptidase domain